MTRIPEDTRASIRDSLPAAEQDRAATLVSTAIGNKGIIHPFPPFTETAKLLTRAGLMEKFDCDCHEGKTFLAYRLTDPMLREISL